MISFGKTSKRVFSLLLAATSLSKIVLYVSRFGMTRLRILTSIFTVLLIVIFLAVILVISAGNLWDGRRDYSHYETKLQKARTVHTNRVSSMRNRNRRRSGVDNVRES